MHFQIKQTRKVRESGRVLEVITGMSISSAMLEIWNEKEGCFDIASGRKKKKNIQNESQCW